MLPTGEGQVYVPVAAVDFAEITTAAVSLPLRASSSRASETTVPIRVS